MLLITPATLREIGPTFMARGAHDAAQLALTNSLEPFLVPTLDKYAINTPLRLTHFLGQTCEESDGFRSMVEEASGAAYEGRTDLGNTKPGDGARFKGRGIIQITGRFNYAHMAAKLGLDLIGSPDLAAQPGTALEIACLYWSERRLNDAADRDDIMAITRAINGGTNGLADRQAFTNKARSVINRLAGVQALIGGDNGWKAIARGQTGAGVAALQSALNARGFALAVDGQFGRATEGAVMSFQKTALGWSSTSGIVDTATWAALSATTPI